VDWGDRLRRLVNSPDDLSAWRLRLLRLVDPIEWYMRKDEHRPHRMQREPDGRRVAYAPLRQDGRADGASDLSAEPPRVFGQSREQEHADWLAQQSELREQFGQYFESRAAEVVAGRSVTIRTNTGTVRARLVRFRSGAVFEHDVVEAARLGHGMTRVDKRTLRNPVPVIADYLIDDVARLGPGAVPLA
jgi:hypothetical protein